MPDVRTCEVRYQAGTSNKFWRYFILEDSPRKGTHWVACYGPIDGTAQYRVKPGFPGDAIQVRHEKIAKGYNSYINDFVFPATAQQFMDWKQSLNLHQLEREFYKHMPANTGPPFAIKPTVLTKPVSARKMSTIEKQLDKLLNLP